MDGYAFAALLLCATFLFLAIRWRATHWAPDEYFHLMHVRSYRRTGRPHPEGWTGTMQHDYPMLFHRFASFLPEKNIRAYLPPCLELVNGLLLLASVRVSTGSWKLSSVALALFLVNTSTLNSLIFAPRAFSCFFHNLLFLTVMLRHDGALPAGYFYPASVCLVALVFLSYKFAYQTMIMWMLLLAGFLPETLLALSLGLGLSVLCSRGRILRILRKHGEILVRFFRSYREYRIDQILCEPLVLLAIPALLCREAVPMPARVVAVFLVAVGALNALGPLAFFGEPLKFFYFARFPLAVIVPAAAGYKFFPLLIALLPLEIACIARAVRMNWDRRRTRLLTEAANRVAALPGKVMAHGKHYYPLFYLCGEKVVRKADLDADSASAAYCHLYGNDGRADHMGDILYRNDEIVIVRPPGKPQARSGQPPSPAADSRQT